MRKASIGGKSRNGVIDTSVGTSVGDPFFHELFNENNHLRDIVCSARVKLNFLDGKGLKITKKRICVGTRISFERHMLSQRSSNGLVINVSDVHHLCDVESKIFQGPS